MSNVVHIMDKEQGTTQFSPSLIPIIYHTVEKVPSAGIYILLLQRWIPLAIGKTGWLRRVDHHSLTVNRYASDSGRERPSDFQHALYGRPEGKKGMNSLFLIQAQCLLGRHALQSLLCLHRGSCERVHLSLHLSADSCRRLEVKTQCF